jgi:hypothetical protein
MERHTPVGVIEGFYGTPWSHPERLACIDTIASWGWNTYVWAAKAEPRHRDEWNIPFTPEEVSQFGELAGRDARVGLYVGLTPGSGASPADVIAKLRPAVAAGASGVVLSFDDLPVLDSAALHRDVANIVKSSLDTTVWIVPTHYAGTTSSPYLRALCDGLDSSIEIMWTGNMVVNDSITLEEAVARRDATGGRAPLVWDNAPVNDALMTAHLHLGPFTGRDARLHGVCSGWLWNPMISQKASMVMLESAAAWWRGDDPVTAWNSVVDRDGWRALAESTAYRGDHHWPGDAPSRQWWESVRDIADDEPSVSSWVASARLGATLALAALDVLEADTEQIDEQFIARSTRSLMMWTAYRTQQSLTFGAGPRRRPLATQDATGRFVLKPGSLIESHSLVDGLVSRAMSKLSR